ncbi:siderophore iron transporter mirA [Penicillium canescens]|nr:siderophore iron transporter mirA [Penicillium canescens]KAJ6159368.1 siderophore iron transporter mirA [Penicillium canescens]
MGPYPQAHQAGPGCHFVIAFLVWAAWFTKKPFVPYRMIKNRTMAAAVHPAIQIWVLTGVPLCVLVIDVLLYLVDMGDSQAGNEASLVMAKSLVGIGPCFHPAASEVSVQAIVSRPDVSVVTSALFASMNIGGVVGTRYLPSLSEMLDDSERILTQPM